MKVSFSHKRSPRRWNPNIQRIRILEGRTPRRRNVCTSCIKANKVRRAV
jgi:large subunit ribosomal protein L28